MAGGNSPFTLRPANGKKRPNSTNGGRTLKFIRSLRAVWVVLIVWYVSRAVLHVDDRITNLIFVVGIPAALFYLQAHRCRRWFCGSWNTKTGWRKLGPTREKVRQCYSCEYEELIQMNRLLR